jgi:valyl-tRNA synthetase
MPPRRRTDIARPLHDLPLIEAIGRDGHMTAAAAPFDGLTTDEARQARQRR